MFNYQNYEHFREINGQWLPKVWNSYLCWQYHNNCNSISYIVSYTRWLGFSRLHWEQVQKLVPILKEIGVTKNQETDEQTINVTVEVNGKFNSIDDLKHLAFIAKGISEIAEDRLSEPEVIKNIGLDCKPFICTDESEETQADA